MRIKYIGVLKTFAIIVVVLYHTGYLKRNKPEYFNQYVEAMDPERFIVQNRRFVDVYGERFIDLMSMVTNDNNQVRVFTPDHHFISADCGHFRKGGAIYFAQMID